MRKQVWCLLALLTVVAAYTVMALPASAAKQSAVVMRIDAQTSPIFAYDMTPRDDVAGPYAPATEVRATVKCPPNSYYFKGDLRFTQDGVAYNYATVGALGESEVSCGADGTTTFSAAFYSFDIHPGTAVATLGLNLNDGNGSSVSATRTVRVPRS
jgi:hypothetical protein